MDVFAAIIMTVLVMYLGTCVWHYCGDGHASLIEAVIGDLQGLTLVTCVIRLMEAKGTYSSPISTAKQPA